MSGGWKLRGAVGGLTWVLLVVTCYSEETELQFEAAFQGRCDHGSPCEQLCYDLHDGMYECDCKEGYLLREDGYSCYEINSTVSPPSLEDFRLNGVEDIIYQNDVMMSALEFSFPNTTDSNDIPQYPANVTTVTSNRTNYTTQGPRLEQKLTSDHTTIPHATLPISTMKPCPLDCGLGGGCSLDTEGTPICLCPLGKGGERCEEDREIHSPRFIGSSWMAFPALRGAYKHVQLSLELRPEAYDGIFFLTGERDDMAGDFMALLLHQGFVEFRFDCGSGVGVVRSPETVLLNRWNKISLYRHRWDAWLRLNGGRRTRGRSDGLFSRITFREPVFIGGPGNTTGVGNKLGVDKGLKGCVRRVEVNGHAYALGDDGIKEATNGYGVEECTADRCSRVPCQHGGKCLTGENSAVCLCPLGFSGDLCEIRVDLQVPAFNGSSHLRHKAIGDDALAWLEFDVALKPSAPDGLLLYDGGIAAAGDKATNGGAGDFVALYLRDGYIEFAFDLGTGATIARSRGRVSIGEWHQIKISRTGRQAVLQVDDQPPVETLSPGAFTQLSLPQPLYIGGVPNFADISSEVPVQTAFVGCVQKVAINGRQMAIIAEALGGANVDNCPHPCVARPCGDEGDCIPEMDYFSCRCKPGYRDRLCARGPPSFTGHDSYLRLDDKPTALALSSATTPLVLNVRFKPLRGVSHGLLLAAWTAQGFLSLGLEGGALVLRFRNGSEGDGRGEEIRVVHNGTAISEGQWHRVKAVRDGSSGLLIVDNSPAVTRQSVESVPPFQNNLISLEYGLYIGGMPNTHLKTLTRYNSGIRGCVADLVVNTDYHLQLVDRSPRIGHNVGECEP